MALKLVQQKGGQIWNCNRMYDQTHENTTKFKAEVKKVTHEQQQWMINDNAVTHVLYCWLGFIPGKKRTTWLPSCSSCSVKSRKWLHVGSSWNWREGGREDQVRWDYICVCKFEMEIADSNPPKNKRPHVWGAKSAHSAFPRKGDERWDSWRVWRCRWFAAERAGKQQTWQV